MQQRGRSALHLRLRAFEVHGNVDVATYRREDFANVFEVLFLSSDRLGFQNCLPL